MGLQLAGRRLGLVGLGAIGLRVARCATAMGMHVCAYDPGLGLGLGLSADVESVERAASLDALLVQSDVLSLHCPLTPQTQGLIGAEQLKRLPRGAILVNAARGSLVALAALVDALRSGQLQGAGLDAFEDEPLPAQSPLRWLSNVLMTPHVGAHTDASSEAVAMMAAQNLVKVLRGEPVAARCVVNLAALA